MKKELWKCLDKYDDKALIRMLWTPMLDDFTFSCIQEELKERGYTQHGTTWVKE